MQKLRLPSKTFLPIRYFLGRWSVRQDGERFFNPVSDRQRHFNIGGYTRCSVLVSSGGNCLSTRFACSRDESCHLTYQAIQRLLRSIGHARKIQQYSRQFGFELALCSSNVRIVTGNQVCREQGPCCRLHCPRLDSCAKLFGRQLVIGNIQ